MRLITTVFNHPYSDAGRMSCVLALLGSSALSLLSAGIVFASIGYKISSRVLPQGRGGAVLFQNILLHCAPTLVMLANLFVFAAILHLTLRITRLSIPFDRVCAACAYAALVREGVALLFTCIAALYASYHHMTMSVTTDATALLFGRQVSALAYHLLRDLDILTIGYLVLVAIGISKYKHETSLPITLPSVFIAWLAYVVLGVVWKV